MVDPETVWRLVDVLAPEDFYAEPHRIIYALAADLALNGSGPPDVVRMTASLRSSGALARVGGVIYLQTLVDAMPDVGNAPHYAAIVVELSRRRRLLAAAQRVTNDVASGSDSNEAAGRLLGDLLELSAPPKESAAGDLGKLARKVAETSLEIHRRGVGVFGHLTGLDSIDELLQGLKVGSYILAGRPGTGKSTLADQIAVRVASDTKTPVLVFVTEMSPAQRAARQVSAATGIPLPLIHCGRFTTAQREAVERVARGDVSFPRVRVESAVGKTAAQVRLSARRFAAAEGKPALIVVDYLQQLADARAGMDINRRTGEKSNQMAWLAQELDVPVLCCSQLSRDNEREKRPPRASDLRESGEIEQDAYAIVFLYQPDVETPERVVCIVAKHKDGPTGKCGLRFRPQYMRFECLADGG